MSAAFPVTDPTTSDHESAPLIMTRESRVRLGPVPRSLEGNLVGVGSNLLFRDAFLLRAEGGIGLLYRKGEGVTLERPADADERDVALWLNGMLYAAIAAINGFLPLHASAVTCGGRVFAFSGASGAGKSTLTAALGRNGLRMFCDDTMIVDLRGRGDVICLPGHKRLKLWPEGLALSGARAEERIAGWSAKHFANPTAGSAQESLPLAQLIFLDIGDMVSLTSLGAGERVARMQDSHYTARFFAQTQAETPSDYFKLLARIAARIPMARFARPFDVSHFDESVEKMVSHIKAFET